MKTKILFIAVAIVCSSLGIASAQSEKKVYSFTDSYGGDPKVMYVSDVVSAYKNKEGYLDPDWASIGSQWGKKLNFMDIDITYFRHYTCNWNEDYDAVVKEREQSIYDLKKQGYTIKYIPEFSYRQVKKSNY